MNDNFVNEQNLDNFLFVAHEARVAFNAKYPDKIFDDPADFDPLAEPEEKTWADMTDWISEINIWTKTILLIKQNNQFIWILRIKTI